MPPEVRAGGWREHVRTQRLHVLEGQPPPHHTTPPHSLTAPGHSHRAAHSSHFSRASINSITDCIIAVTRAMQTASLTTSLAALSLHPHTAASQSACTPSHHFTPPAQSQLHGSYLPLPTAPSTAFPAPVVVSAFSPLPPSASVVACLRHFLAVQEQRALTYSAWQAAFRHYTASKEESDLHSFTTQCQHATTAFQQLSLQVKLCIAHLQSIHSDEWAVQLQEVQRLEREKLGLTVAMQELTSEWVVRRKEEFSSELQEQLLVRRQRMDEVVEAINDILSEAKFEAHYRKQS